MAALVDVVTIQFQGVEEWFQLHLLVRLRETDLLITLLEGEGLVEDDEEQHIRVPNEKLQSLQQQQPPLL